jgi:urease accessory protein
MAFLMLNDPSSFPSEKLNFSRAELEVRSVGGNAFISHQLMPHPFHMTVPFSINGDPENFLTLYIQSSSGGLYDCDIHELNVDLQKDTNFHLTTQASTIVHEAKRHEGAYQKLNFKVKENSYFEYLPDPVILMAGSKYKGTVSVELSKGAKAVISDSFITHDPQAENQTFVECLNETKVFYDNDLVFDDKYFVRGVDYLQRNGSFPCIGSIYLFGIDKAVVKQIESQLIEVDGCYFGCSISEEHHIVVRILAQSALILTEAINIVWSGAREIVTGEVPEKRRK